MSLANLILGPVLGIADKVLERVLPDPALRAEAMKQAREIAHKEASAELEAASAVIVAEAKGESAAQRNWRPHLMYLIMGLLVFNGVAVPLVEATFAVKLPILEAWTAIPENMWTLLQIGVGGYVAGRTIEKAAEKVTIARKA